MNDYVKEMEAEYEELQNILAPVYTSGLRIEDYKKVLFYFCSLSLRKNNKRKVLKNWTLPYVESLLLFLSKLEEHKELMKESKNYIR